MHHAKKLNLGCHLLIIGLLLCSAGLRAQADPEEERPGFLERFVAIFKTSDGAEPATVDSITAIGSINTDLTERYAGIYNLIHREQEAYYRNLVDSSHTKWDELTNLAAAKYISPDGDTVVLAKNVKVFGWHPHWMGNAYESYPFALLSHISLFSYNLNAEDGAPYDNPSVVESWESDDFKLVELAHAANCKVMITISSFGADKNRKFLNDPDRQQELIEDVVARLVRIDADGIDLDFELVPRGFEKQLSAFILRLHERLALGEKRYQLSVVLPKVNGTTKGNNIYNVRLLQEYVDFFTLTAYDFTTGDFASGPIAPLYNGDLKRRAFGSIEDVVFNYLEAGLEREKLLLGLPYYGGQWTRHIREEGPDSLSFQHLTYSAIRKANRRNGPPEYNRAAWSAVYRNEYPSTLDGFVSRQETTWFDDSLTLSVKYDWVLEQGLGGVGLWALGYDLPHPELWGLVDEKFAPVNDTMVYFQPVRSAWNVPNALLKYGDLFGISGLFVFAFLAIGFIVAIFDWRVREVFFSNKTLRLLYIVASFALVTATLAVVLFLQSERLSSLGPGSLALLTLVVGLVSGVFIVRLVGRWFARSREGAP